MTNVFNRFQSLVGSTSTDVVTITANNGDGTSAATTLAGDAVTVKGETVTTGNKAYVRNGEVIRQAPSLTITTVSI